MNTTLILTTIGAKNAFDIVSGTAKLLTTTTKVIVNNNMKHKDVTQYFKDSDILLKIDVIETFANEFLPKSKSSTCLLNAIKSMLELLKKELDNLNKTIQYNQKVLFSFSKKETDSILSNLDQLLTTLESRLSLLQKISQ